MTVVNETLVVQPWSKEGPCPLWIWDLPSDRVWTIGAFQIFRLFFWHADADNDVLVTFEVNGDEHPPLVQQTKWSLTRGEVLNQKTLRLTSLAAHRVSEKDIYVKHQHTYGNKTEVELRPMDGFTTIVFAYDYAVDRLSAR